MTYPLNPRIRITGLVLAGALAGGAALTGCQEVNQPTTTLTQAQWQEVKAHILTEAPDPQYPVGARFGDKIELIGFDISNPLVAGKPVTFTWYWKALSDIEDNWKVFVHFDSSEKSFRQHLDHHPLGGLYQTGRWKKGQIIKDVQKITIESDYPNGQAVPYIGFYKGDQRLPIKNGVKKTQDRRVIGPALVVKNAKQKAEPALPTYSVARVDDAALEGAKIDGKLDEAFWKSAKPISLTPFGAAPDLKTEVRVARGADHLLIGAHLPDEHVWSKLDERDADTWTEEVFEVYIDRGRDGKDYLELQINPLGTIFDANFAERLGRGEGTRDEQIDRARAWNLEGLESAVAVDGTANDESDKDKSWTVELKIPFSAIPGIEGAPKDGAAWAANFYRYDRPDDKRTFASAWSKPNGGSFHQVERFGTLQFGKAANAQKVEPKAIIRPRRKLEIDPANLKRLIELRSAAESPAKK
jgi:hypothetical protein